MTDSNYQKLDTVGAVSIELFKNSVRLRYRYQGKRQVLSLGADSKTTRKAAKTIAQLIDSDLAMNRYDETKSRYSHKYQKPVETVKPVTLGDVWEFYLENNSVAETTKKIDLRATSKVLAKLDLLSVPISELSSIKVLAWFRASYKESTCDLHLRYLTAAFNLAIAGKLISTNPINGINKHLDREYKARKNSDSVECYSLAEAEIILAAFKSNQFCNPSSAYKHSYYADFVEFRLLTGTRIEEATAIEWSDVDNHYWETITIDKAYRAGILKTTKTYKARKIPISDRLKQVFLRRAQNSKLSKLVFPSQTGDYINADNFNRRYWNEVIHGLLVCGKLDKKCTFYSLRHTFATTLLSRGCDVATIAKLLGDTKETAIKHYLGANSDFELPEF